MSVDGGLIEVESGVSLFDGKPFVVIRFGSQRGQMRPAEARQHALKILECAEAAEADAHLVALLRDTGLDERAIGMTLMDLRTRRAVPDDASDLG